MNRLTGFAARDARVRGRARQTAILGAVVAVGVAVTACSGAHAHSTAAVTASGRRATAAVTASGPRPSGAVTASRGRADGAAGIGACGSGQWTFSRPVPEGDGPVMYVPVQVQYTSGPRCRLDITFTARLTDASGGLIPGGTATGAMRAIIGPAAGERQTALTSMTRSSFLWYNWCGPADGLIHAVVTGQGHVGTTVTPERPMCLDARQPVSFTWGAPKKIP